MAKELVSVTEFLLMCPKKRKILQVYQTNFREFLRG